MHVSINRTLNPKKVERIPKEIKEEITKYMEFGEIKTLDEIKFDEKVLNNLLKERKDYLIISDWVIPLTNLLEEEREEPLYRLIYKRLKKLQQDYRNKVINAESVVRELKNLTEQIGEYRKQLKTLSPEERILKAIFHYLREMGIKFYSFCDKLEDALRLLINNPPSEEIKKEIRKQLKVLLIKAKVPADRREKVIDLLMEEVILPYARRGRNGT